MLELEKDIEIARKENEGFGENSMNMDTDRFNPVKFVKDALP